MKLSIFHRNGVRIWKSRRDLKSTSEQAIFGMVFKRYRLGPVWSFTGPVQILPRKTTEVSKEVRILGNPGEAALLSACTR